MGIVYRNETSFCGPINMVILLTNGDLVVVFREALWRGYSMHGDPTTRTSMVRSTDGGETWHSQVTPAHLRRERVRHRPDRRRLADRQQLPVDFRAAERGREEVPRLRRLPRGREDGPRHGQ